MMKTAEAATAATIIFPATWRHEPPTRASPAPLPSLLARALAVLIAAADWVGVGGPCWGSEGELSEGARGARITHLWHRELGVLVYGIRPIRCVLCIGSVEVRTEQHSQHARLVERPLLEL